MSTQVQTRRGNTAQTAAFTGVVAELTVDTDKKVVVVHDGTTAGGIPLSKESTASTIFNHANGAFDKANSANVLAQSGYNQANTATTSAQAAFDKANQTAQLAFTTVSANGTNLVADANNDTLTITSAVANGVFVSGNSSTDALDIGLIDSGVTASGYGDSISVPTFVVDSKGRLTSASNTTIRSGTTSQTGVVQLEDSVTSTSTSNAATPASVKTAYDLATTANNNAVNAGTYANAAFDKANSANVLAQSGYNQANTATTTAGLSYNHANGAFDKANTATTTAGLAYNHANGAFDKANSANVLAQSGYNQANTATTTADAAFAKANSANVIAQSAFDNSNTKFNSSGGTISGDTTVTGNLTIIGQTVYANTTTALIADNIITLNAAIGQASAPTVNAGIEVDRGSSANVLLQWNETTDKWQFTNDGSTFYDIADAGRLDSVFSLANGTAGVANTDFTTISTTAGVYGNASYLPVVTLTANGRVSSITNTAIAIDTAAITSGTLDVVRGGTGVTTSTGTGSVVLNTAPTITSINVTNTTVSTSNTTGAITVAGGIGVKGNVYADAIYDGGVEVITFAQAAFNQANSVYLPSVTRLDVTHSGSSAYLIDQYTGNNPELYIRAGETLAFNLAVTGHPFLIRVSSGGTQYNTGLTHVTTTGTVTTGSSAQGQVTGTLYWKVPAELSGNTYVYQCSIHGGMVGNIVIERPNQANSAASYANSAFAAANSASGATSAGSYANSAFLVANTPSYVANSAASYANSSFITANTPSNVANSAASYANSGFTTANSAASYANSAFSAANSASGVAAAGSYANSAFATANNSAGVNLTQNTSITSAFAAANSAGIYANSAFSFANTISGGSAIDNVARALANTADIKATSAGVYANSAFLTANTPSHVANSAAIYANSAFAQANSGGVTIGDVLALSIALG